MNVFSGIGTDQSIIIESGKTTSISSRIQMGCIMEDVKEDLTKYQPDRSSQVPPLTQWIRDNNPDEKMSWKGAFSDQVCFVRDRIPGILANSLEEYQGIQHLNLGVISTHVSKSIKLPVYELKFRDFTFTIRHNFHDWKISVEVPYWLRPIEASDFERIFDPALRISHVYCEGFPKNKVFGSFNDYLPKATVPYADRKFTIEISEKYSVFTFFYILNQRYIKPGRIKAEETES